MSHYPILPTSRLEAFSDGVYAIVITLLVLELHVPESADRLLEELLGAWPSFLGYLVSFVFIGGSWLAHTSLTRLLGAADEIFSRLNLLLLLFVSFLPFTTSLMANHLTGPGQRLAAGLFGVDLTLATVMLAVLATYPVWNEKLVDEDVRSELRQFVKIRWSFAVLLALSTVVGAVMPALAVAFYLTLSGLMLVQPVVRLRRRSRRLRQRRSGAQQS